MPRGSGRWHKRRKGYKARVADFLLANPNRPVRKAWESFVKLFIDELGQDGSDVDSAALLAAQKMSVMSNGFTALDDKRLLRRAKLILRRPEVSESIREYFEVAAGFTSVAAASKLVDWIQGRLEIEKKAIGKDGEVIDYTEKIPPNLEALKTYFQLTMPKPVKQVQVDQRTLVAKVLVGDRPPATKIRALAENKDALPSPD